MNGQPIAWEHRGVLVKVLLAAGLMRCSECHQGAFSMVGLARIPCAASDSHHVRTEQIDDGRRAVAWCTGCDWLHIQPWPDGDNGDRALGDAIRGHTQGA